MLALVLAMARAAAPVGASLLYAVGGGRGYDLVLLVLLVLCVGSTAAVLVAGARQSHRARLTFAEARGGRVV